MNNYGIVVREAVRLGGFGEEHGPMVMYAGPLSEYHGGLGVYDEGDTHVSLTAYRLVNLTPHPVVIRAGTREITVPPCGEVARVASSIEDAPSPLGLPTVRRSFGEVEGIPAPQDDTCFVVSSLVLEALRGSGRTDVLAPDTGPESAIRDDQGRIVAVTRLICL